MSLQTVINYDNPANFTFSNANLAEIVGAVARLKDLTIGGKLFSNFNTDKDANWSDGSGVGTLTGGAAVAGGLLDVTGASGKYLSYVGAANTPSGNLGTIRIKFIPNYNGSPAAQQFIFDIGDGATSIGNNQIRLVHKTDGDLQVLLANSAGVSSIDVAMGAFVAVLGVEVEFELDFDVTTGATRLFVNGVQLGATIVTTFTRNDTGIAVVRLGDRHVFPQANADFSVNDFSIWDIVKHTANYTLATEDEEIPTASPGYSTNNPNLLVNSPIIMDGLDGFAESKGVAGADQVKYALCLDGVDKYWDGAAWSNSNGTYAQANLASEIEANKVTFPISLGGDVKVRAFLHSDDGTTFPSLTSVTVDYNFFIADPTAIPECVVYTFLKDQEGDPVPNAKFRCINKNQFFHSDHNIGKFEVETLTNVLGYAELSLIETASVLEDFDFEMVYTDPITGKTVTDKFPEVTIPNATSKNLDDIV